MEINILSLSDGAKNAKGITVIIDVYRAFTTQSFAFENGVKGVVIIDGRKSHSILFELFSDEGAGTLIRK